MTTFDEHANLAVAYVSAGSAVIGSTTGDTLIAESDGVAAEFPAPPFNVTVWRDPAPLEPAAEIMRVVGFDGHRTFTVERGQEDSVALAGIAQGWRFANTITAKALEDIEVALNAEESARESGDAALSTALGSEAATRAAADSSEATTRAAADTAEASARVAADSTLQGNIDAEATTRASGDAATLSSAETYADGEVAAEAAARIAGDASTLTSAKAYTDAELAAETYAALADVDLGALEDGDIPAYDLAQSKWRNRQLGAQSFDFDFVLTYEAPYYKILDRSGVFARDSASPSAILDQALASFPNRSAKVLLGRSYGVAPNDVFAFDEPIVLGESTVLQGLKSSLRTQDTASGLPAGTLTYHPATILDFSGQASEGIETSATAAYRCQWPALRDFLINGSGRTNGHAAIKLQPSAYANPDYEKVGGAMLERVYVTNFQTGVDLSTSDGTLMRDCAIQHVTDCILDGSSEPTVESCDFWDFTGTLWKIANIDTCYHAWFGPANQIEPGIDGTVGLDWRNVVIGEIYDNVSQEFAAVGTAVILRGTSKRIRVHGNHFTVFESVMQIVNTDAVSYVTVVGNTGQLRAGGTAGIGYDLRTGDSLGHIVCTGNTAEGGFTADVAYDKAKQVWIGPNAFGTYKLGADPVVTVAPGPVNPSATMMSGPIEVVSDQAQVLRALRDAPDAFNNALLGTLEVIGALRTADAIDGFGPGIVHAIEDLHTARTEVARVAALRNGSNQDFDYVWRLMNAGTVAERLRLLKDGRLRVSGIGSLELGGDPTTAGNVTVYKGTGNPNGVVTALPGSIFLRTDGGAGASAYVKESGSGNTGWTALTTANASRSAAALAARNVLSESSPLSTVGAVNDPGSQNRRASLLGLNAGDVVTNILVDLGQVGVGTAPTAIFLALYNSAGVSVAVTNNLASSSIWTTATGPVACPLSSPYTVVTGGGYYGVFLINGQFATTPILLGYTPGRIEAAKPVAGGVANWGIQSGKTELTTALALGTSSLAFWFGVN
jgi:hypothetical protein